MILRDFSIPGLYNRFFNQELPLKAQVFHLLAIAGIVAGFVCTAASLILSDLLLNPVLSFASAVLAFVLLWFAEKYNRYHFCSWSAIITVFGFIFPLLYFTCGGYKTGAPIGFFIAFTFTAMLLEHYERIVALAGEYALYVALILLDFTRPELAVAAPPKQGQMILYIACFTFVFLLSLLVLSIRTKLYKIKQGQIEEYNRELAQRNESLAQYDHMKSDFLATVAHEINTPLAVIAASSNDTLDLLKEAPLNLEEIIENQIIIDRRVKLIDHILLDLMDTVAIETGRLSLNRQPVYLPDLLKNIGDAQFKKLDTHHNQLSYDFQPGTPQIWVDPQRLEQVLANLLSNACLHTKNGRITIKLVRAAPSQIVSVCDDGEGMDPEMARVVFRQYVSTKADYWRHGIGLAICRRIILAHNGEIWVESEQERGTTISFSLKEDTGYE